MTPPSFAALAHLIIEEAAATAPAEAILQPRHQLLQLLIVLLLRPLAVQLLAQAAILGGLLGGANQAGLQGGGQARQACWARRL